MVLSTAVNQLPFLILISFDGFRNDYLKPELTPNLYDLSPYSVRGHMESMYMTKTFPNHFSIATGLYEDEHEIINNKMFDPSLNSTFKPGNSMPEWWNPSGRVLPIWTANQMMVDENDIKSHRHSASMMYPGAMVPFADTLPTHLKDFDTKRNWTQNVDTVIEWMTDPEVPANFVAMYFDDPDNEAHRHGPWGEKTLESVRGVDSAAGYLVKRLRDLNLASKTNIIFVSDHGMAEVNKLVYLEDFINITMIDVYGASPDWNVFVKPKFRSHKTVIFQTLLRESKKNHFRVYKRQDIPPEYHYSKSKRVGDFFILVDHEYELLAKRSDSRWPTDDTWGNHGWRPTDPDMRPFFMATGPSFKEGYYHMKKFPNIDLFPLMGFLLGIPSKELPNNGSLERIIDMVDINHFNTFVNGGPVRDLSNNHKAFQNLFYESSSASPTSPLSLSGGTQTIITILILLLGSIIQTKLSPEL